MTTALLIALGLSLVANAIQWSAVRIAKSDRGREKGRADTMTERLDSLRAVSRDDRNRLEAVITEAEAEVDRLKGFLRVCESPRLAVDRLNALSGLLQRRGPSARDTAAKVLHLRSAPKGDPVPGSGK